MKINREELQTMIREFWAVNNNDACEAMTIIFLRRIGLTDIQISNWLDDIRNDFPNITKEHEKEYLEALESTKDYYGDY